MGLAAIPPGGENKILFEIKLVGCTAAFVGTGLVLYWRGARKKARLASIQN
jgi:hypothetical protein